VALLAAVLVGKGLGPRRADERTLLEAGAWIRTLGLPAETRLLSRSEKIPWYAGLSPGNIAFRRGPEGAAEDLLDAVRRWNAPLLALDAESQERYLGADAGAALRGAGFVEAARFERTGCIPVVVYRTPPQNSTR
jgi:hypothetical protein